MIRRIIQKISPRNMAIKRWVKERGDETYRLDYALNPDSMVIDLGGYKGDFSDSISNRYNCHVMVFEPVPQFADAIRKRFENNEKVRVFDYGLEECDRNETILFHDLGSSSYKSYNDAEEIAVEYKNVVEFFKTHNLQNVDLMKINIEGGEYDLLEAMIKGNIISRVDNLQIQFHDIESINARKRMKDIQRELKKSHYLTWKFRPFVWENWKRK